MSHFTVMVRVPSEIKREALEEAVGRLMDPFCEHTDKGRLERFMVFKDHEDEYRQKYETESCEMVKLEDGTLVSRYDDRFKDPKFFGSFGTNSHIVPEHLEKVDVPFKQRYATFEQYMLDYCGEERDEKTGRYGYYHNPNAKWDYWRIGGRWRGKLLTKPEAQDKGLDEVAWEYGPEWHKEKVPGGANEVDYCRISALDFARIDAEAREAANKFWAQADEFFAGREFDEWKESGPRTTMLDLGILDCFDEKEMPNVFFWRKAWERTPTRYDVVVEKPSRDKLDDVVVDFMSPIRPYAFLDSTGWHARGRMGWFGAGDDTPESNSSFAKTFNAWLKEGDQDDWIVMVDCHI